MKLKVSQDTYDELQRLVDCALAAGSKKAAEPYIKRMTFLHMTGGYGGPANILISEVVSSAERASGRISDKERLCGFAKQSLYKLSDHIGDEDGGC